MVVAFLNNLDVMELLEPANPVCPTVIAQRKLPTVTMTVSAMIAEHLEATARDVPLLTDLLVPPESTLTVIPSPVFASISVPWTLTVMILVIQDANLSVVAVLNVTPTATAL